METLQLKGLDQQVSRLCIGGCPAGEYGWGHVSRQEIEAAILSALDMGVTFFDTADTYGLGRSEETLGETLRGRRGQVALATKFGVRIESGRTFYDNSPSYIDAALKASLGRLGTDYIDLYQVHYLDGVTPIPQMMEALLEHKRRGSIRGIGLSNLSPKDLPAFLPYAQELASFQNHYSLAHRNDEAAILDTAQALDVSPLTWGSLGQGVLTGKYGKDVHFEADDRRSRLVYDNFYGDKLEKNLRIVEAMRPIARKYGVSVASVAIRWILDTLPRSVVITGVKTPRQAQDNAMAFSFGLTPEERAELDELSR